MAGFDPLEAMAGPPKLDKPGGDDFESPNGAKVRAMKRLGQALASKDYGAAAEAFKAAYEACVEARAEEGDEAEGESEYEGG